MVDQKEFVSLLLTHRDRIHAHIAVMLPHLHDAEDVLQRVCLLLWEKQDQYDAERPFLAWAFGMARLEVFRYRREHAREQSFLSEEVMAALAYEQAGRSDGDEARDEALRACLQQLPHGQREMVEECYASNDSIKEIARRTQSSLPALYKRLHRIRRALLDCVGRALAAENR